MVVVHATRRCCSLIVCLEVGTNRTYFAGALLLHDTYTNLYCLVFIPVSECGVTGLFQSDLRDSDVLCFLIYWANCFLMYYSRNMPIF